MLLFVVIALLSTVNSQSFKTCPLVPGDGNFQTLDPAESFCSEYSSQSCCNQDLSNILQNVFLNYSQTFGNDSCGTNLRNLMCGWVCGPTQSSVVDAKVDPDTLIRTAEVYLSETYVTNIYHSCRDICVGNQTFADIFTTPLEFIQGFQRDDFGLDGELRIRYYIGHSSKLEQYKGPNNDDSTLPASTMEELTGCTNLPPGEAPLKVQVVPKKDHPWIGRGSSVGYRVDGVEGATLTLYRGIEYEFRVDASCEYPFYLSTDVSGNGRGRYDKGGLAFYCEGKVLKFTPTEDTPDTLYYQCLYEERMGGQIDVRDLHPDPASELKPSLFFVLSLFLYLFIHLI